MAGDSEAEVKLWPSAICRDCGRPFPKDQDWAKKCFLCWKESKDYDLTKGDKCFLWAQVELQRIVEEVSVMQRNYRRLLTEAKSSPRDPDPAGAIDSKLLREVIGLCHPDKHGDSAKATEVTQQLLALRALMK